MHDPKTTATDTTNRVRLTDLTILLDRSGSMKVRRAVAMSGFNDLLVEQRLDEHEVDHILHERAATDGAEQCTRALALLSTSYASCARSKHARASSFSFSRA